MEVRDQENGRGCCEASGQQQLCDHQLHGGLVSDNELRWRDKGEEDDWVAAHG